MAMLTKEYHKAQIRTFVMQLISEKISTLDRFIKFTIEATRDIKKTPKYDTAREEAHEEIFRLELQLHELNKLYKGMARVLNTKTVDVQLGSLVITNKARFYISVSLGQFFYEGDRMYAISEKSPMAQTMIGKKIGDEFILNGIQQRIEEVF